LTNDFQQKSLKFCKQKLCLFEPTNESQMKYSFTALLFFTISFSFSLKAQNNQIDSLLKVIDKSSNDSNKVNTLNVLAKKYFNTDPEKSIFYGLQSSALAKKINFKRGLALAYKYTGTGYLYKGNNIEAIKSYQLALAIFDSIGDKRGIASVYTSMGGVYYNQGGDIEALELNLKALKYAEESKDTLRMETSFLNIGAIYGKKVQTYDKAIEFYHKAFPLAKAINDNQTFGVSAVNLGEVYMNKGNYDSAEYYFDISLKAVDGTEDAPYTLNDMGALYMLKQDYDKAIEIQTKACILGKSLDMKSDWAIALIGLAKSYKAKKDIANASAKFLEAEVVANEVDAKYSLSEIYLGLSELYTEKKDFANASKYQSLLLAVKDSIYNLESDKKLGTLQFTFDLDKQKNQISLLTKDQEIQQQEIARQKLVRNGFVGGFAVVLVFAGIFFRQRNKIKVAKKRSDELLLNILPEETAEELKETGTAKAKKFDLVSVMFTDFKNFTQASELLSPEELVKEIDACFSAFDTIITKYGIEKIKTIGDAYMCASGLPVEKANHAEDIIKAGLEMQAYIEKNKKEKQAQNKIYFELRLGIHSGPVVAGVVGTKKFAYDIWGDAVNTASRMESSGEIGKVNISGSTYELVKDKFNCVHRGKIQAKNKGEIDMYFVEPR